MSLVFWDVTSCTEILNQALPVVTEEDVASSFIRKFCKFLSLYGDTFLYRVLFTYINLRHL
jgi:hypothetical protein